MSGRIYVCAFAFILCLRTCQYKRKERLRSILKSPNSLQPLLQLAASHLSHLEPRRMNCQQPPNGQRSSTAKATAIANSSYQQVIRLNVTQFTGPDYTLP